MISIQQQLRVLPIVESTNNYAMAHIRAGLASHGEAFFAMEQTAGKGQRGKEWLTEAGANIILTVALKPGDINWPAPFSLSVATALACCDFFSAYAGDESSIKWPNDLYWRDRKAGGILIENVHSTGSDVKPNSTWQWAVVGIGININQAAFHDALRNPVSLRQITGKKHDIIQLANELCLHLEKRLTQLADNASQEMLTEYNKSLFMRGKEVRLKKGSRVFQATIKEVTSTGELVIAGDTGEQFSFGEIEWLL